MASILVVDDEIDLAELVAFNLRQAGHTVSVTHRGADANALFVSDTLFDLVVLDRMLPDLSGIELCRRLRQNPRTASTPVLMLTAKGQEEDRIEGLEAGADDYVPKPFNVRELVLRVQALLRRAQQSGKERPPAEVTTFGVLEVDACRHEVRVCERAVLLTALEFRLLTDLLHRRGRVQTREALLERVWGYTSSVETRTVDTHVKRLREKLGEAGEYIETVRGVGYRVRDGLSS